MTQNEQIAIQILDVVETMLEAKGIEIPCTSVHEQNHRHDGDNDAKLYGSEYSDLQSEIVDVLCFNQMKQLSLDKALSLYSDVLAHHINLSVEQIGTFVCEDAYEEFVELATFLQVTQTATLSALDTDDFDRFFARLNRYKERWQHESKHSE